MTISRFSFDLYCDFIEFNFANNETESNRNFTVFLNGKSLALQKVTLVTVSYSYFCIVNNL